jgi:alpha-glucosidase (family GH31 glycosyl hydrolase)
MLSTQTIIIRRDPFKERGGCISGLFESLTRDDDSATLRILIGQEGQTVDLYFDLTSEDVYERYYLPIEKANFSKGDEIGLKTIWVDANEENDFVKVYKKKH